MTRGIALSAVLLAASVLGATPSGAASGHGTAPAPHAPPDRSLLFDGDRALAYSQAAVGRQVGDHRLTDQDGRSIGFAELRGRPLVLSMIYTSCAHTCPLITQSLRRAVDVAREALGESFAVATIGFDVENDTPARMRQYGRTQGVGDPGWRLLAGDADTMARLAADTGFIYVPSAGGFEHLAQVTILDGEGRVYRQVYGETPSPQAVVEPLKELVFGWRATVVSLDDLVKRVRLLCTVYDARQGRYRFSYAIFIGLAIGLVSLAATGTLLVRGWIAHARRRA